MGEPHRQREPAHGLPCFGRPAVRVDGVERQEQGARFGERRCGRRIQEAQGRRVCHPEGGTVQHHSREVGFEDLRRREGRQRRGLLGAPEAQRDARRRAAGAAGALVGRGARHANRLQPREPGGRLEFRQPGEPAIHHHAHPVDGDRGLRYGSRQHHLAAPRRGRPDGRVLRLAVEHPIERQHVDVGIGAADEPLRRALDLALPRQEGEHAALFLRESVEHGGRHRLVDGRAGRPLAVSDGDGMASAGAFDHRRVAEEPRHPCPVERRRHCEKPEIGPQGALHVERQSQSEIAIQGALVKLVQEHGGDPRQLRLVEDHPRQHALGDHEDTCRRAHSALHPHGVSHRPARLLGKQRRHAPRRCPRRQASRLQDEEAALRRPWLRRAKRAAPTSSFRLRAAPPAPHSNRRRAPFAGRAAPRRPAGPEAEDATPPWCQSPIETMAPPAAAASASS